jgi:hypothetical protein
MAIRIGIITVRDSGYHPNRRLLDAARAAGHQGVCSSIPIDCGQKRQGH